MSGSLILAETSVLWLGLRLILSLGIVLALIGGLTWVAKRGKGLGLGVGGTKGTITVRARETIGRTTTVALLEVGGRVLLIGANEQAVEVLAEGDDLLPDEPAVSTDDRTSSQAETTSGPATPGMSLIEALRERSVRRS